MNQLSWDQAFDLAAIIRAKADDDDKRAADFDTFTKERGFTPASVAWAVDQKAALRDRAKVYREFARQLLKQAEGGS